MSAAPVAVVGMACIFPGAPNLEAYWHNLAGGVDAITDVPPGTREARLHCVGCKSALRGSGGSGRRFCAG